MGVASAAMGAGGSLLGGVGSILGGISEASQDKYEARIAQQNANMAGRDADVALDQGDVAAQRAYQQGAQQLGAQRAQMAANGVTLNNGSALDVQNATAMTTGQNVAGIQYNANARAVDYRNQVVNFDNEAAADKKAASSAILGGAMGAAGSLIGGASQFADKWDDMKDSGALEGGGEDAGMSNAFAGTGVNISGW
ncbi:hypothetical protein LU298_11480 [Komagataeibacter intermedius]|uniref:Uncharacterized protein n=2 Tax=Komagataeibacter intermedius TaxID=66229 RepID=A0A0N1FKI9_9PROT|nr:hypothetical protein [Komagataeibacter intermedius]KPH86518.1 hypothetical protein GLUCOINTEAF2_0202722 [Komagataeibacter intermedius AF2]MCF3637114.1 hypothetical protein [Komagataeibacter intermedius]GAN88053.1 hypothetical protein Gain_0127_019 [Komagataeibacter intermedius TF2]GBQ69317.1 hypothetical protein AA0521_1444 [Komagataeibacter intermedius NRIC 0521]